MSTDGAKRARPAAAPAGSPSRRARRSRSEPGSRKALQPGSRSSSSNGSQRTGGRAVFSSLSIFFSVLSDISLPPPSAGPLQRVADPAVALTQVAGEPPRIVAQLLQRLPRRARAAAHTALERLEGALERLPALLRLRAAEM